jgi:ketosteroid isomerase-like protein
VKTLQDLLDVEEIKNLRTLYSHYFDGQEIDKLMGLFTEDVICEFGPEYGGNWVGHETIRKNFLGYMENEGQPWSVMHAITNHIIELTGPDTARGRCYLLDLNLTDADQNPLFLVGVYDDLYRKADGRWLIDRTRIDFLWPDRHIMESR